MKEQKKLKLFIAVLLTEKKNFFICPECDEPIYADDWNKYDFTKFFCPICEFEGDN